MKWALTRFLNRNAALFFLVFAAMAAIAFWPNYFSRLDESFPEPIHLHAFCMTFWVFLLIAQASLIRFGIPGMHRILGYFSFVLVPVLIWSGLRITRFTLQDSSAPSELYYTSAALMINSLIVFGIIYLMAILFRKNNAVHARFMIATVFPILTPVTDRLIYFHFPELVTHAPRLVGSPLVPSYGFALGDILVLLLLILDWRSRKTRWVFAFVLGLLLAYHFSYFTFYQFEAWQAFADWFLRIPV